MYEKVGVKPGSNCEIIFENFYLQFGAADSRLRCTKVALEDVPNM